MSSPSSKSYFQYPIEYLVRIKQLPKQVSLLLGFLQAFYDVNKHIDSSTGMAYCIDWFFYKVVYL